MSRPRALLFTTPLSLACLNSGRTGVGALMMLMRVASGQHEKTPGSIKGQGVPTLSLIAVSKGDHTSALMLQYQ
jgi:hypothetical protein